MLTIATVLKSGGDFHPEHVLQLRDGVARNLSLPFKFVCLTDMPVRCEMLPLLKGWPGWWSKLELFDGRLKGPVLYFDLDTIITGSLDDIALGHRFTVLQNFWADQYGEPDRIGSGMMAWSKEAGTFALLPVYLQFAKTPNAFMAAYRTKERWGDQGFIKDHVAPDLLDHWQRKHPGRVVSFKKHVLKARRVPGGASVVCFHGVPRPWALPAHQRAWFEREREAA